MNNITSQENLVERLQSGDKDAFCELMQQYQKRVFSFCTKMLPYSDAEDASQEAFLRLYKSLTHFKGNCTLSTYIYTITVNCCRDILRKEKRRNKQNLIVFSHDGEDIDIPDLYPGPDEYYEKLEDMSSLKLALKALPSDYREVLLLRVVNELSYNEIADICNISCSTVKARLFRARQALKRFLEMNTNFFPNASSNSVDGGNM